MRKFKVTIRGRNLLIDMDGVEKHSVLVVRFAEAQNEALAGKAAIENFYNEPKGQDLISSVLNSPDDPFIFEAEEVLELASFDHIKNLKPGLSFFPES